MAKLVSTISNQQEIFDAVTTGAILAYPTESVFGLGCDPRNVHSLERIIDIKGRGAHKGFIIIAATLEQLEGYLAPLSSPLLEQLGQDWPGPITYLLPSTPSNHALLTGDRETIACRVSLHPTVVRLCDMLGGPLVSTSANISGHLPLRDAQSVQAQLGDRIDLIVDESVGELDSPTPIIDGLSLNKIR